MKKLFVAFSAVLFCVATATFGTGGTASAATVDFLKDIVQVAPNLVAGGNLGGLDTDGNFQYANGSPELDFLISIDDSGDTGAMFTAVLTFAGTTNGGANEVSTNPAGRVVFLETNSDRNQTLTFTVGSITQTSGPTAIATFDGIDELQFDQFTAASDSFTFNGLSYNGSANPSPIIISPAAPSGSSVVDGTADADQFRFGAVGGSFTVSAALVPEPSSLALLAISGLGVVARRRKR